MTRRRLSVSAGVLVEVSRAHDVYHTHAFLDADSGMVYTIADDLIDYCRGDREGTDLQLSDSHDLPVAQAVAEEMIALEKGFDAEGLPYGEADRRYFPLPRLGEADEEQARSAVSDWLKRWNLETSD